ncbi:hypothetical protein BJY52DRAFT_1292939 [Lactarius psammicola]|nr:hypothetical protein BJY52DRAFT_1292939 [Lactarius psammicola]
MSDDDCNIRLPVGSIGWSQDSISGSFRDGKDIRTLVNSLRQLSHEERVQLVGEFPPIRVVGFVTQGYITLDNRRLFLFRQLLDPGTQITVRIATYQETEELKTKLTTNDEGATIVIPANRKLCQLEFGQRA